MNDLGRREFTRLALAAFAAAALPANAYEPQPPAASARGRRVYQRAVVIDGCGGPGGFVPDDPGNTPLTAAMVADAKSSGITAVNLTVGAIGNGASVFEDTLFGIGMAENEVASHPDTLMRITHAAHLHEAKKSGRLGLIYGFQDGSMLGSDLQRLETFYHLGVRIIQPTYNIRNLIGDGCLEAANAGLSNFGRGVLARMEQLGILLDLSHCGQRTTPEAIAAAKIPMAITHSGCAAIANVPRNKRDEELRAMAAKGGVVGIYFMPFLRMSGQPTSADAIAHLDHAINVCGEDHVGLGTDGYISAIQLDDTFRNAHRRSVEQRRAQGISAPGEDENVFNFLPDLNTPRRFETLVDMLLAHGYSEARVEKVLGGNFARLFGEVWKR